VGGLRAVVKVSDGEWVIEVWEEVGEDWE